jgi:hypothetical protein
MMANERWKSISEQLLQLRDDPALQDLRVISEKLHQASMAEPKPTQAEGMEAAILVLREMGKALQQGSSIEDVLKTAGSQFYQPNWTPEKVYQAQQILQYYITVAGPDLKTADPPVEIPVVLVVMTAAEAEQLSTGSGVGDQLADSWREFSELRDMIERDFPDWTQRYDAEPSNWKPFGTGPGATTVKDLLIAATSDLSGDLARRGQTTTVVPRFINIRHLREDRELLRDLRDGGCVLVVDSISMCHPTLHVAFNDCNLDPFLTTSIVTISPMALALEKARLFPVVFKRTLGDFEWARRLADRRVKMTQSMDTSDEVELSRWLFERVGYFSGTTGEEAGIKPLMRLHP